MTTRARVVRSVEGRVLGAAGALGERAGDTLVRAADSVVGRLPGGRPTPRRPSRFEFARARVAWERGSVREARRRVDRLFAAHPASPRVLELRAAVLDRQGDVTERARMLHRLHLVESAVEHVTRERLALGELVVTTPGWLPRIQGLRPPVSENRQTVLLLQPSHRPGPPSEHGFRHVTVEFPRTTGASRPDSPTGDDGVERHEVGLGRSYPPESPVDQRLADEAWLAAAIARRVRPSLIHASTDDGTPWILLTGIALREHLGCPLVCEAAPWVEAALGGPPPEDAGERFARTVDTLVRAFRSADHVIAPSEAAAAALLARGVAPARLTVIARGVAGHGLDRVYGDLLDRRSPSLGGDP